MILFIPTNYVALTGALTVKRPPGGLSLGVLSGTLRLCAHRAAVLVRLRHQAALLVRWGAQGARCGAASPQRQRAFPSRRTGDRIDRSTHCLHHIHALTRAGECKQRLAWLLTGQIAGPLAFAPSRTDRELEVRSFASAALHCRCLSGTVGPHEFYCSMK